MKHLLIISFAALLFASCGASQKTTTYCPSFNAGIASASESTGNRVEKQPAAENRMVIYKAYIEMNVKQPDTLNSRLPAIAGKYEGYVVSTGSNQSVIRVKAPWMNKAVNDISLLGRVTAKSTNGEDVTDTYTDFQIRLANADSARKSYLKLLAKAENVEAALLVEKELERLNGEIDLLKGKINMLQHLSDYSTITVTMDKKVKPGLLGYVFVGLYDGIKWLFVRG